MLNIRKISKPRCCGEDVEGGEGEGEGKPKEILQENLWKPTKAYQSLRET